MAAIMEYEVFAAVNEVVLTSCNAFFSDYDLSLSLATLHTELAVKPPCLACSSINSSLGDS